MSSLQENIIRLLDSASRVTGLSICFHDRIRRCPLPQRLGTHTTPACCHIKKENERKCAGFDGLEVHQILSGRKNGRIHTCPFGLTEIAVPVSGNGIWCGVLFAGQCWMDDSPPPLDSLIIPENRAWLEDRLVIMESIAGKLFRLLTESTSAEENSRKNLVLNYISAHLEENISVSDLGSLLNLSKSRAGHVVKELFGQTFPELVNSMKLNEAAHLLSASDMPISEISFKFGFYDQNYFSRLFKKKFSETPGAYRKKNPARP